MRIIPMNDSHRRILRNTIICTVESLTGKLYDRKTWQATGIAWQYYQAIPAVQNSGFFPFRSEKTGIYRKTPEFPEFRAEGATKFCK